MFGLKFVLKNIVTGDEHEFERTFQLTNYMSEWLRGGGEKSDVLISVNISANIKMDLIPDTVNDKDELELVHTLLIHSLSEARLFIKQLLNTNIHNDMQTGIPDSVYQNAFGVVPTKELEVTSPVTLKPHARACNG